jgi:hypothetical protein
LHYLERKQATVAAFGCKDYGRMSTIIQVLIGQVNCIFQIVSLLPPHRRAVPLSLWGGVRDLGEVKEAGAYTLRKKTQAFVF